MDMKQKDLVVIAKILSIYQQNMIMFTQSGMYRVEQNR